MESDLSQFRWDVVALRTTAFPKPSSETLGLGWWDSVIGEPPEERKEQPRTQESVEHAKRGKGRIELQINPVSVNWIHHITEVQPQEKFEALGEFQSNCEEFTALMNKWFNLDAVPDLGRLAFGAVLIQSAHSHEAGLERLAKYIRSVQVDPDNTSDFLYQINRRRASRQAIDGLVINRLTKWSVGRLRVLMTQSDGRSSFLPTTSESLVQLEIDINTVPEFEGVIKREEISDVFEELVELGSEIALKGDVS
ncbi:MAG: hypothetical protein OXF44_14155 [Anaerolineaceae bacterium]|nr:hypothetical protein [Anaerolineaceae bacterium]